MSNPQISWQRLRAGKPSSTDTPPDRPVAAVFRCADAQVTNEAVFDLPGGWFLDVSTWSHALDTSVLASIEYAVETLEVPLVVVLGHDDCPAMHAALQAWDHAELPGGAMRSAVEHALMSVVRRGAPADSVQAVTAAHIVETGLALTQRSPVIAHRVDRHECGIVCATYSSSNEQLHVHATIGAVHETADALIECI